MGVSVIDPYGLRADVDFYASDGLLTRLMGDQAEAVRRLVGTCRHFAVLATAFSGAVGIPARARCGFASYFFPTKQVDHWIAEHWRESERRWVRIDAEVLGADVVRPAP